MRGNRSVDVHQFAMVPRADIPRSSFKMESVLKTTFDSGWLVPVYCEEMLPGDTFSVNCTFFARLATPIFPVMDNLHLDSFFFFVPYRLVWSNWKKFMGEQASPGDSISYVIPQMVCPAGGYAINSLWDYFGLPTVGQVGVGNTVSHSALPLRAYDLIYNEWFKDENLINAAYMPTGDGPDSYLNYTMQKRGKRHDYFTSCLPFLQKGTAVSVPIGTSAPIKTSPTWAPFVLSSNNGGTGGLTTNVHPSGTGVNANLLTSAAALSSTGDMFWNTGALYADLSTATAATINQLRQSFQIQKLLERDARGGTRYTEIIRSHFGVVSPDFRLQRPEYLGGGSSPIVINPVAQTSNTPVSGTPQGNLAAFGTHVSRHGFTYSATEHGIVIGIVNVRADLTYQQGLRKFWSRSTRYDFYWPEFCALGEQSTLNREIYCDGSANDTNVFGYQERWAEYRYQPSMITGLFRSTAAGTIDPWHLAQKFTALPTLNQTFIEESPPLSRVLAVGSSANGQQLLLDAFFQNKAARPMPLYSVPGLIDHF